MYSIEQLQAVDYLLKRIIATPDYPFYTKNLKFVVEINSSYWYGDFVEFENTRAYQVYIDDSGDLEKSYIYPNGTNASIVLKQLWDVYGEEVKNSFVNPFRRINDAPLLFEAIIKLLNRANIVGIESPFRPYLLNACSLDGRINLPFINLEGESIKIVSIIEIND